MKQQKTIKTPKGTELPLTDIKGKDYLGVPQRLIWFREEKAMWSVETEIIESSEKHAIFKATIKDESGRIIATAHKHETPEGFFDFREKAESGAIGRALGYLGYGTAFALELDEGEQRIVDTPQIGKSLPSKAPIMPQSGSFADYTLKTGKNKGILLKHLGIGKVMSSLDYWKDNLKEPATGALKADLEAMEAYVLETSQKNPSKVNKPFEPPPITDYKEPRFDSNDDLPPF